MITYTISIRKYLLQDALPISHLIKNTLLNINIKDYSNEIIDKMYSHFSPERIHKNSLLRDIYVAINSDKIVGTVSTNENNIHSFFVDHNYVNHGIGSKLLKFIEKEISGNGFNEILVPSSITSKYFYEKHGFVTIENIESIFGKNIIMKKVIK